MSSHWTYRKKRPLRPRARRPKRTNRWVARADKWQSLLGSLLALAAAIIAVVPVYSQLDEMRKQSAANAMAANQVIFSDIDKFISILMDTDAITNDIIGISKAYIDNRDNSDNRTIYTAIEGLRLGFDLIKLSINTKIYTNYYNGGEECDNFINITFNFYNGITDKLNNAGKTFKIEGDFIAFITGMIGDWSFARGKCITNIVELKKSYLDEVGQMHNVIASPPRN